MPLQLPSFLRRRLRLYEARRALLAGALEEALEHLSDPALALSEGADRLRGRALDLLCREAARSAAGGDLAPARRMLERVADQDPERARLWRARIEGEAAPLAPPSGSRLRPRAESGILEAMEELLLRMRAERRAASQQAGPAPSARPPASATRRPAAQGSRARLFHLDVDDAGEYLVASGEEIVLGHLSAGRADLRFLADLDSRHATIRPSESFHAGPGWHLAPVGTQRIELGGRAIGPEGARLADGDLARLSGNLAFVFRTPDPGSASALLELQHGAECEGAGRILLLAAGAAGAVRIGGRADRHVRAPGLRHEVRIALEDGRLDLRAEAGLVASGLEEADGAPTNGATREPGRIVVDCPPSRRVDFTLSEDRGTRPPFGFVVRPLDERRGGAA